MTFLDMKTLITNQIISYALGTGIVAILWWQHRHRYRGLGLWLVNALMQTAAFGLLIQQDAAAFQASSTLRVILIFSGVLLFYVGLGKFLDQDSHQLHNIVILTLLVPIHIHFTYTDPNLAAQNIISSIGLSILFIKIVGLLFWGTHVRFRSITKTTGYVFLAYAITSSLSVITNIFFPSTGSYFLEAGEFLDAIFILVYQILFLVLSFSLFLMIHQRLLNDFKKSETRYRELVEFSPDALFVYREGKLIYTNPTGVKLLGAKKPKEIIGKPVFDFLHPDYHDIARERIKQVREKGKIAPLREEKLIRVDGKVIDVEVTTSPLEYQGQPALQTIARDISGKKETQEKLSLYQDQLEDQNLELRKLSMAIEQSGNTIMITDTDGLIQYVNPRFEETTGYTAEEVIGKNPSISKSGKQDQAFYKELWDTITSGKVWHGEFHNLKKDGTSYWETSTIAPVQNDEGEVISYIAIKDDITAQKEMQAKLERLATTDSLTGTLNRHQFKKIAKRELKRAARYGHPVSLIMLDIDSFKTINDQHGHTIGDLAIKKVANILKKNLRDIDYLGRYGGDEFIIILPETNQAEGIELANRLRVKIANNKISNSKDIKLSISIGLTTTPSGDHNQETDFDTIVQHADRALYQAKEAGRNFVKSL